ncbi:uncharacterized protein LOC134264305 [Saccostrea cucullata]|uniref:uncharacterized protein LOC134261671 n=1 Tax=Saccostrea cuccullata TaxID=36930 RepID=UPI002ED54C49
MKEKRIKYIFLLLYLIVFVTSSPESQKPCKGTSPFDCCSGYSLDNKTKTCVKCPEGFIGRHCEIKCPFPTFGLFCQSKCVCHIQNCNFAHGCITNVLNEKEKVGNTTLKTETNPYFHYNFKNEKKNRKISFTTRNPNKTDMQNIKDDDSTKTKQIRQGIIVLVALAGFLLTLYIVSLFCKQQNNSYSKMGHVFLIEEQAL